jgi:hypothetical protein
MAQYSDAPRRRPLICAVGFSLTLGLLPVTCYANIVFPSVVQWLSAAGPYSLLLLPTVFTFPLLLLISTIEALIARAILETPIRLVKVVAVLFLINALTSAIGLITMPNGTELFPGLPLAFLATTVLEGLCLIFLYPRGKRHFDLILFKASAVMNGASYAFLGLILALLIYLPSVLMPNNLNRSELAGQVVMVDSYGKRKVEIDVRSGAVNYSSILSVRDSKLNYKVVFIEGKRWLVSSSPKRRIAIIPGGPYHQDWQISADGRYYANYVYNSDTAIVGDVRKNTQKVFRHVDNLSLCPKTGKVALLSGHTCGIYDPTTDKTNRLSIYGMQESYGVDIVWSPNGKYIAHTAIVSPFTQMVGEPYIDGIRIVSLDGRAATIVRDLRSGIYYDQLLWLPAGHDQ